MFPSGAQPPSQVPQCLTEVTAAENDRAALQDLGLLLSLCVCSVWRTVTSQGGCSNMQQSGSAWFPDICILKSNIVEIEVNDSGESCTVIYSQKGVKG